MTYHMTSSVIHHRLVLLHLVLRPFVFFIFFEKFPFITIKFLSFQMPPKRQLQNSSTPAAKKLRSRANPAGSDSPTDLPASPNGLADLSAEVDILATQIESLRDSLGEVQDRLASFEDKFSGFLDRSQGLAPGGHTSGDGTSRSPPIELIRTYFSWLDAAIIDNIVSGTLEVTNLIKLIPLEERSKLQVTPPGINFDLESGKPTVTTEFNVAYEKHFPNFASLISALAVYAAVRSIADVDNTGIGFAVTAHIRLLSSWYRLRYPWNGILMYEIAFLRKFQQSYDFSDWAEVRNELFTYHITRATILPPSQPSSSSSRAICRNFNGRKGCTYKSCVHRHVCLDCQGDHTQLECKAKESHSLSASNGATHSYLSVHKPFSSTIAYTDTSFIPHRDKSFIPQRDTSFIPQRDTSFIPHRDKSFIPHRDKSFIPHRDKSFIPHRDKSFIPHRDTSFIPHRDKSFIPHRDTSFIPHRDTSFIPHREYQCIHPP